MHSHAFIEDLVEIRHVIQFVKLNFSVLIATLVDFVAEFILNLLVFAQLWKKYKYQRADNETCV